MKWRTIEEATTKRVDGCCVTSEKMLVKGLIDDEDYRIVEANTMVNRNLMCVPVRELNAPELAESNERIRKWLVDYAIEMIAGLESDISRSTYDEIKRPDPEAEAELAQWQKARAYLEKQKVNTEGDFGRGYDCGYQAGYAVAMNEMKPKVATATLDSDEQKKQKPRWEINNPHTTKWTKEMIDEKFEELVEQKPVEWSEEDLEHIKSIIHRTEVYGGNCLYGRAKEDLEWLKNLLNRFLIQPKPAWSEEDEKMLARIIERGQSQIPMFQMGLLPSQIAWLKSLLQRFNLQPKQEWSEKDENALKYLHELISFGFIEKFFDTQTAADMREWLNTRLKSLRPQSKEELAKMLQDEYNKGKEIGEREGYTKGYNKGYKDADESFPVMPTTPSGWGCDGTHCTNPHMDCINCPIKSTGGINTASGTSTATLHGNTSATDGKEHNPSFTD